MIRKIVLPVLLSSLAVFLAHAGGSDKSSIIEQKRQEILQQHNTLRRLHGLSELQLTKELNIAAQKWAESLAILDDSLNQRTRNDYGENQWMSQTSKLEDLMNILNPIRDWYNENQFYPGYYDNATFSKYANFTQLIWKNTKELGAGIAVSSTGNLFVVCNYNPKGNKIKQFKENVIIPSYMQNRLFDQNASAIKNGQNRLSLNWIVLNTIICTASILFH